MSSPFSKVGVAVIYLETPPTKVAGEGLVSGVLSAVGD